MTNGPRDRTRLGRELWELEQSDPDVRAAGERLDRMAEDISERHRRDWCSYCRLGRPDMCEKPTPCDPEATS